MKQKWEHELQALKNALESLNLTGHGITLVGHKFVFTDETGLCLTGTWDYKSVNHFIMGYGVALKRAAATPSPLPEIEKPMTKDEYWETMADLKTDVKRNTTPGNERQEIEKQSTQLIEELKQDWEEIKTRMKELEALEALEAGFYMAICRAYNAGKQNVIDDAAFISSYEYFKSEFPGFTKNVPCDY